MWWMRKQDQCPRFYGIVSAHPAMRRSAVTYEDNEPPDAGADEVDDAVEEVVLDTGSAMANVEDWPNTWLIFLS